MCGFEDELWSDGDRVLLCSLGFPLASWSWDRLGPVLLAGDDTSMASPLPTVDMLIAGRSMDRARAPIDASDMCVAKIAG